MERYIIRTIKIVIFIVILVTADKVLGYILQKLYFNQWKGPNHSLTYVLSECKADVLVFGNSRAVHHYDSRIIGDSLKMSCYNAGQDGGHSILLPYAQIKVITQRYSPKIIILEFSPDDICHYQGDYDRLSIFLPYYKKFKEIRPIVLLRDPYESIKLISAIYPFNSNVVNIIAFNTNYHPDRNLDFKGYLPLKTVMRINQLKQKSETAIKPIITEQPIVDSNKVKALENIISLCREKNISLFIINSPMYHLDNEIQGAKSQAAISALEIIHRNNVNYLDFSYDSTFSGRFELFKDKIHLNDEGAKVYSKMLIRYIKFQH